MGRTSSVSAIKGGPPGPPLIGLAPRCSGLKAARSLRPQRRLQARRLPPPGTCACPRAQGADCCASRIPVSGNLRVPVRAE